MSKIINCVSNTYLKIDQSCFWNIKLKKDYKGDRLIIWRTSCKYKDV